MQTLVSERQSWLSWFLRGLLIFGFLILLARLIDLQIIRGNYFRLLAEGNRIRRVPIIAPRGNILARGGELLVGNREVIKRVVFEPESGYRKLEDISEASADELISEPVRDYKLGNFLAHVSGYLGEVIEEEVGKVEGQCPEKGPRKIGSWVGRGGLEENYNCVLSGIDGEELVEIDSNGRRVRILGRKKPIAGVDVKTTIDFGLQKKVAELMEGKKGAVVVSDTKGEVLALYSSPSFDPNLFVGKVNAGAVSRLLNDKELPLYNRVIGGSFHPGSVFKPIVAIAALEEGKIDENFIYHDPGIIKIGNYSYANWYFTQYGKTEGAISLTRAITRSTDTFFYKLGELTGVETITRWAEKFGLGEKTNIDIPGEITGLIPTPEWKLKVKGERWFLGNTYHLSIGQGDIALTPIAVNMAISAIASNGKLYQPHIISIEESRNFQSRDLGITEETIKLIKEGMQGACRPGGTGFTFFDFEILPFTNSNDRARSAYAQAFRVGKASAKIGRVACKTGTAETGDGQTTHAWFTVFGPVDPLDGGAEIVATVLIEKGGEGAYVAGPIAREIFDYWFVKKL